MPISFELSEGSLLAQSHYRQVALDQMRPISRKYDLAEHELPREWVDYWWKEGRWGAKGKPAATNRSSNRAFCEPVANVSPRKLTSSGSCACSSGVRKTERIRETSCSLL